MKELFQRTVSTKRNITVSINLLLISFPIRRYNFITIMLMPLRVYTKLIQYNSCFESF